jgi:NTP pyrophosphatase (non-canonical NTP hydrolase)
MIEESIASALDQEVTKADAKYGNFRSTHEGLGVLLEEFTELQDAIHDNDLVSVQHEAIQVAAVALRIAAACKDKDCQKRSVP